MSHRAASAGMVFTIVLGLLPAPAVGWTSPDAGRGQVAPLDGSSDPKASSQELIDADVTAGRIDYGTSLIYRAWALFWDARLPKRYDGTGSTGQDPLLLTEIEAALPALPAEEQSVLQGYLTRPTDPLSPFGPGPASGPRPDFVTSVAGAGEEDTRCTSPNQWLAKDWSPDITMNDTGFRAWACAPTYADALHDLNEVLAIGSVLWAKMTVPEPNGMGLPVPDTAAFPDNDGNGKIDIYLLSTDLCRERQNRCEPIPGGAVAAAQRSKPCNVQGFPPLGCSGYLLVGRDRLSDPDQLMVDMAHEFFHVLQFAHNGLAGSRQTGLVKGNQPVWDLSWYLEASATWAAWYYVRDGAKPRSYTRFRRFQTNNLSLLQYGSLAAAVPHQYQSWVWPLFQQVERGASNVFRTWQVAESAVDPAGLDAAIGLQLPFESAFRDFAVRNVQPNAYRPPASSGLEDETWQTNADLTDLPTNSHVLTTKHGRLVQGNAPKVRTTHRATIAALAAQYDQYVILDAKVRQITIDVSALKNSASADLDVVGRLNAQPGGPTDPWARARSSGHTLTLCRDLPEEDFNLIDVVISNHASSRDGKLGSGPDRSAAIRGTYSITTKNHCDAPVAYEGTFSGSADFSYSVNTWDGAARFELTSTSANCVTPSEPPTAHELRYCYRFAGGEATWSAAPFEKDSCAWDPQGPVHVTIPPMDDAMELVRRDPDPDLVNWYYILVSGDNAGDATMPVNVTCNGVTHQEEIQFSSSGGSWIYTPGLNYIGDGWQLVDSPMVESQSWSYDLQPLFDEA